MSDYTVDVRAKVTPEQHRILSLYAQLHGMEIAEVVRSLLLPFLSDQAHKATAHGRRPQRRRPPRVGAHGARDQEPLAAADCPHGAGDGAARVTISRPPLTCR